MGSQAAQRRVPLSKKLLRQEQDELRSCRSWVVSHWVQAEAVSAAEQLRQE